MPISSVTATTAELNILDGVTATAAELNYLDLTTLGTGAASKSVVLDASKNYTYPSGGTFTLASANVLSGANTLSGVNTLSGRTTVSGNVLPVTAGVGISGIAAVYATSVERVGTVIHTTIWIDITGLRSSLDDNDIIGDEGTGEAHIGQLTVAVNGTLFAGKVTTIELPAAGNPAIALWAATETTGVEDTLIGSLTSSEVLTSGGDSSDMEAGEEINIPFATLPAANKYLYLVNGDASGPDADYTGGIIRLEFWGV